MEVQLWVPHNTDISILQKEYPDIYLDFSDEEEGDTYFIGISNEEANDESESEWMTREQAIEFCGFAEGSVGGDTLLEGNGQWAQSLLRRTDFSSFHSISASLLGVEDEYIEEMKKESLIYHNGFLEGRKAKLCATYKVSYCRQCQRNTDTTINFQDNQAEIVCETCGCQIVLATVDQGEAYENVDGLA